MGLTISASLKQKSMVKVHSSSSETLGLDVFDNRILWILEKFDSSSAICYIISSVSSRVVFYKPFDFSIAKCVNIHTTWEKIKTINNLTSIHIRFAIVCPNLWKSFWFSEFLWILKLCLSASFGFKHPSFPFQLHLYQLADWANMPPHCSLVLSVKWGDNVCGGSQKTHKEM